jgi:hypothetical protein
MNIFYTQGFTDGFNSVFNKKSNSLKVLHDLIKHDNSTEYEKLSLNTQFYLDILYPNHTIAEKYELWVESKK